jgi:hypothetical protein
LIKKFILFIEILIIKLLQNYLIELILYPKSI